MIKFRDKKAAEMDLKLIVHKNKEGIKKNINPFDHENYTDIMKTNALKQILTEKKFDFVYGGASETKKQVAQKKEYSRLEILTTIGILKPESRTMVIF